MGGCSVTYCRNRFVRGSKHFFRFPKDWRMEFWIQFTQQKNNFQPKGSSTICEDHFAKDSFQKKKDRVCLSKDAVPTIMLRQTSDGVEKIEISFDLENRCYNENDFSLLSAMFKGTNPQVDEDSVVRRKQQKLEEFKSVCRFCFCNDAKEEFNCIPINKLESYSIDINELITLLGMDSNQSDLFSDILCEQCFQQIVEIDAFRRKCKEAQQEMLSEIQEIDEQLTKIQSTKSIVNKEWIKGDQEIEAIQDVTYEVLEEHLIEETDEYYEDDQFVVQEVEQITSDDVSYIEDLPEDFKIIYEQNESKSDKQIDHEMIAAEQTIETEDVIDFEIDEDKTKPHGIDEYEVVSTDDIIKNPERNRFCFRIYECFFCKMKFAGRKTFIAHKCPVSKVQCEQCDKTFTKVQAYNSHLSHVHNSLPISRHYCPICKTVIVSTLNQFKTHRRVCNKQSSNQPIECEVCQKVCNNLKGYTIHKLFHDTRNFTTSTGEKIASEGLNVFKGTAVCELCGKEFQSLCGYRMHKRNVHRVGSEGTTFQCHICSKICPTRRSLFDHMRNTHRVQESPCNVCGKIFRTKILLKKHMMYHDETKRIFMCNLCPGKPGYFTNVALKRHQKSHLGSRDFYCTDCGANFTTNHQLKVHKTNKHGGE